jgi:hypothetical protein
LVELGTFAPELCPSLVFFSLTICRDPPAGINVEEGKHYNPYFPGGVISMKQARNFIFGFF